jgi:transposase, IS30 family
MTAPRPGTEGDLIIGKDQGAAIGTLVEWPTRLVRLLHLSRGDGQALHDALRARMADLPPALLRSITWDQEPRWPAIARSRGHWALRYFCDSHSAWQRGSNGNANGLLRDYFPKDTDLSAHSPEHLLAVENELNNRPGTSSATGHPPNCSPCY